MSRRAQSWAVALLLALGSPRPAAADEADYAQQRIGFDRISTLHVVNGGLDSVETRLGAPYRGSQHHTLDQPAFYEAVGHPEHARFYRQRGRRRLQILLPSIGVFLLGAGLTTGGALAGVLHPFCRAQDHEGACLDSDRSPNAPLLGVGVTFAAAGIAGIGWGASVRRMPTTREQDHRLAIEHNRLLRERLGLPPLPDPAASLSEERPLLLIETPPEPRNVGQGANPL